MNSLGPRGTAAGVAKTGNEDKQVEDYPRISPSSEVLLGSSLVTIGIEYIFVASTRVKSLCHSCSSQSHASFQDWCFFNSNITGCINLATISWASYDTLGLSNSFLSIAKYQKNYEMNGDRTTAKSSQCTWRKEMILSSTWPNLLAVLMHQTPKLYQRETVYSL